MGTKIRIKSGNVTPFNIIYLVMDTFYRLGPDKLLDSHLGFRSNNYSYQYSETISGLFLPKNAIYFKYYYFNST